MVLLVVVMKHLKVNEQQIEKLNESGKSIKFCFRKTINPESAKREEILKEF